VPKYRYIAVDAAGKRLTGVVDAPSMTAVADRLHRQSYLLLHTDEVGKGGWLSEFLNADIDFHRGVPPSAVAYFTRELAVMLEAGQDIDHALRFLVEISNNKRATAILQALRDSVRGGKSLAVSLAKHPRVFSRLYVSIVRAGEAGGQLAEGLSHLAVLLERERRLSAAIQTALIYPILLVTASVGTIVMLLTYVLPQFTPIFAQAGAQLPLPTRVLIGAGDFIRNQGLVILIVLLGFALVAIRGLREPPIRMACERAALHIPVVGALTRRVQAARLTRTLGTLLRNGVGLVPALAIAHDVLDNLTAATLVDRATSEVKAGARLAASLAAGNYFPVQTIHLLRLGEETGKLADMALRAAEIHDEQVHHTVTRVIALLVPFITIVMGLVVAGIVGSLLVAMLSLNDLAL